MLDLLALFEKHADEYTKFELVENPRHDRPDLCAFLMLHDLVPLAGKQPARDMIIAARHDEIWLDTSVNVLAMNATEADIVTLIRCGVRFDRSTNSLCMYV